MHNFLSRLPRGMKFVPTDEELIRYYLYKKVSGGLSREAANVIKDYNLYGEEEPWEIYKKFEGHKSGANGLYFFTTLIKKTLNSTRKMNRTVGTNGGTWHANNCSEIKSRTCDEEIVIGTKRSYRYKNPQQPDQHHRWLLLQYASESISKDVVICQLKFKDEGFSQNESRKRKSMSSSGVIEVSPDDDPIGMIQSNVNIDAAIHSEHTMAQLAHEEPQQIIQNQEMWPVVGTISIEDDGGRSTTGDTFYNIQNVGHEDMAVVNIKPVLQVQPKQVNSFQELMINEHQKTALASFSDDDVQQVILVEDDELVDQSEAVFDGHDHTSQNILQSFNKDPINSFEPIMPLVEEPHVIKNQEIMGLGVCSAENSFENAAEIVNVEPMKANEKLQMSHAGYNGDEGVGPAGDNVVISENAAPTASAIPVMDAGLIEYLKNETNWFANFQELLMEDSYKISD